MHCIGPSSNHLCRGALQLQYQTKLYYLTHIDMYSYLLKQTTTLLWSRSTYYLPKRCTPLNYLTHIDMYSYLCATNYHCGSRYDCWIHHFAKIHWTVYKFNMIKVTRELILNVFEQLIVLILGGISIAISWEVLKNYKSLDSTFKISETPIFDVPTIVICFSPSTENYVYGVDFNISKFCQS